MTAKEEDSEVRFAVEDTGPGIPEENLPDLFGAFWQPRGRTEEAASLGLAIARGIVESHGGRIWVQSELGRGTTFHFSIPTAARPEPQPRGTPRSTTSAQALRRRVE